MVLWVRFLKKKAKAQRHRASTWSELMFTLMDEDAKAFIIGLLFMI